MWVCRQFTVGSRLTASQQFNPQILHSKERCFPMYQRDCTMISNHAMSSPDGLRDVGEFTICTVNMPLSRVLDMRRDVRAQGLSSKWLSATKREGFAYLEAEAGNLWSALHMIAKHCGKDTELGSTQAVDLLMQIPGVGMVKAGFIAQMCGFEVACLDRHNIRALGMSEDALRINKKLKQETRLKKIQDYVSLCRASGGSEYWWDTWCNYVADKGGMNKSLPTGDAVSAYHVTAVMEV